MRDLRSVADRMLRLSGPVLTISRVVGAGIAARELKRSGGGSGGKAPLRGLCCV